MSGLAKYLLMLGKRVGGSDITSNEYTDELIEMGASVSIACDSDNLEDYELIVYTDAVRDNDYRLCSAKNLGKEVMSRGQLLYEISRQFKKVIAVSGCHGKTTCTSMLTHIFYAAGLPFTSHIGGKDIKFSNFYHNGNDFFITEACEYKKNFLLLKPDIAVILNSDADHMECYGSESALKTAYIKFAESSNIAVSLYHDLAIEKGISFGFDNCADYYAKNIKMSNGITSFTVCEGKSVLGTACINVYGKHNVLNALAAVAIARISGISFEYIRKGLQDFYGVERRFENIGTFNGAVCIADYAHHPNEIRATIRIAQKITSGKLIIVFQPHTYSRTKYLFKQFVKVFSPLNNLLIYKTYAAREYFDDAGSALTLSQSLKKSCYGGEISDIVSFISEAKSGDTVLFLGAGDIYFIAKDILSKM